MSSHSTVVTPPSSELTVSDRSVSDRSVSDCPVAHRVGVIPVVPLGDAAQLAAVVDILEQTGTVLTHAKRELVALWCDETSSDTERRLALRALDATCWKVQRMILPLVDQIPRRFHSHCGYLACLAATAELERQVNSLRETVQNRQVDLRIGAAA